MPRGFELLTDFIVKEADPEKQDLVIEGYANTTTKDRVGDVILEEAWNKGGIENYKKNPIILGYHDYKNPIGVATTITTDSKGLKITAKISKAAGNIIELIKDNILKSFSVGFRVKDADYDPVTDIFVIKDLELYEISVVSVPANADSIFSVKKSFENENEYKDFVKEFSKEEAEEKDTIVDDSLAKTLEKHSENNETIKNILEAISSKIDGLNKVEENKKMPEVTDGTKNVEQLLADLSTKVADLEKKGETTDITKLLEEFGSELKANKEEIESLRKNKMQFEDKSKLDKVSAQDKCTAVLLAKVLNRPIESTKFAKNLIEKSGAQHYNADDDWEQTFSTTVYDAIRQELVVEPIFTRRIAMNTPLMHFPVNPDAGTGFWIPTGDFNTAKSTGDEAQSGIPQVHQLSDEDLIAYKLAVKEYIGYEEEEDSLIPLMPIIQSAISRRMARSSDIALLRGAGSGSSQPTYDPISGLVTRATANSAVTTKSIATGGKVTVADLATLRRNLGIYGLNPSQLLYVVSLDVYYDLLDDPDFRSVDLVGQNNATILSGQIGAANGVRIVVSGEFEAKANTKAAAVCVNQSNFILGELRGMRVERDVIIREQQTVLVATRRMGFRDIIAGYGVSALKWAT